jgi:hypothetical protein
MVADEKSQQEVKKRQRRRARDIERTHFCTHPSCGKGYGSEASLIQHERLKHRVQLSAWQQRMARDLLPSMLTKPAVQPLSIPIDANPNSANTPGSSFLLPKPYGVAFSSPLTGSTVLPDNTLKQKQGVTITNTLPAFDSDSWEKSEMLPPGKDAEAHSETKAAGKKQLKPQQHFTQCGMKRRRSESICAASSLLGLAS